MPHTGRPSAAADIPSAGGPPDARVAVWALATELERRHHISRIYARACPAVGVVSVCLGVTVWCTGGRWLRWRVLRRGVAPPGPQPPPAPPPKPPPAPPPSP